MRYLALLFALSAWLAVHAQDTINTGLNGDFEIRDFSVGDLGTDDECGNMMDHAYNWHSTINSPDYINPPYEDCRLPSVAYVHQGQGAGYFVAANTHSEFAHTQAGVMQAGHTYEISFWLRRERTAQPISQVGITVSSNPPVITAAPFTTSVDPIITFKPTGTQYVQYHACYTAQVSGMHYFGIGPHGGLVPDIHDNNNNSGFLIDDLVITELDASALLPTAEITTAQSQYCVSDTVLLDASGSTNVTSYTWEIVILDDTTFHYQSDLQQGSPGILNFSDLVPNPQRGVCYKATLQVYGICTVSTEIEFCFENPTVPFVSYNTACATVPLDIVIDGGDNWNYIWSQGSTQLDSGQAVQQITVFPSPGSTYYTVTFTTPEGCTGDQTILVNASDPDNLPPTMNGINGTGEYTIYVQQGTPVSFTSLISNDHGDESLLINVLNPPPSGANVTNPSDFGDNLNFFWGTTFTTPTGEYHYTFIASDRNNCAPGIDTFDFKIVVVCNYCPICIDYEGRSPDNNPLPSESNAGQCIKLGLTEIAATGTASVIYHAGEYFEFGDFFEAGPGFEAIIAPTTCVENCANCCSDWQGFTHDPFPNIFLQGITAWGISDTMHPYCAFGATSFELYIVDRWGELVYQKIDNPGTQCCPYTSFPHTLQAITWDGHINHGTGQGNYVDDGVYFWYLYLHGCTYTDEYHGYMETFGWSELPQNEDSTLQATNTATLNSATTNSGNNRVPDDQFCVFPNPTKDFIRVKSGKMFQAISVIDEHGKIVLQQYGNFNEPISTSGLSAGQYRVQANFTDGSIDEKTIVKE